MSSMAPTLRKRLSKRQPSVPSEARANDDSLPSPKSLALTPTNSITSDMAALDIKDPPPLTPEHQRSLQAREDSRNSTPPQSLLERYKRSAAPTPITTDSPTSFQSQIPRLKSKSPTAFSEHFDRALSPAAIDSMDDVRTTSQDSPPSIRKVNRIDFEMVKQKMQRSSESSSAAARDDPDMPRGLTIRKVQATDSQPSPATSVSDEAEEDSMGVGTLAAEIPAPLKLQHNQRSVSSYRQARQATENEDQDTQSLSPVLVRPPPYNDNVSAGFQWVSPVATTSRPQEPWGWMKKWTCCKCAHLDPYGRRTPAQTMVEQTTCARLGCKHERCASGCKMVPGMLGSRMLG